jgi:hypothetical protein
MVASLHFKRVTLNTVLECTVRWLPRLRSGTNLGLVTCISCDCCSHCSAGPLPAVSCFCAFNWQQDGAHEHDGICSFCTVNIRCTNQLNASATMSSPNPFAILGSYLFAACGGHVTADGRVEVPDLARLRSPLQKRGGNVPTKANVSPARATPSTTSTPSSTVKAPQSAARSSSKKLRRQPSSAPRPAAVSSPAPARISHGASMELAPSMPQVALPIHSPARHASLNSGTYRVSGADLINMASPKPTMSSLREGQLPTPTSTPQRQLLFRAATATAETTQSRGADARRPTVNAAAFPPVAESSRRLLEASLVAATGMPLSATAAVPSGTDSDLAALDALVSK